jgi:PDZ domain-containing secreted protein
LRRIRISSSIVWNGTSKQAAYQVAYRNARKQNTPLYETLYKVAQTDKNGVKHIIPVGNELLEVN